MTDIYSFPDPGNPEDFLARRAQAQAQLNLDSSPDDAARAIDLGKATGIPSPVVASDLERIDGQYKARLTAGIIDNNQFIRDYINAHPLAAAVSNDDYGQLDSASQALGKFSTASILQKTVEGFKDNFNLQGSNLEFRDYQRWLAQNPLFGNLVIRQAAESGGAALMASTQLASGVIGAGAAGIGELYKQMGGNEAFGDRLTRDLIQLAQVGFAEPMARPGAMIHPEVTKMIDEAAKMGKAIEPYLRAGEEPPVGVHPLIDEVKVEQAKLDKDNLNEALKEAQKSTTRDRAPDLFADFARQHTDAKIGISADAIRAIYGDKVPEADDNLLGWVPDIGAKLEAAEATGGDVEVPLADYLAKVEPEVAKELEDHVRLRPGGLTVQEAKDLPEQKQAVEAFHGTPHEFEAFDTSKIGTGEGAQSYGYGHYLAEAPEVAQTYQMDASKFGLEGDKVGGGNLLKVRIHRRPEEFLDHDRPVSEQGDIATKISSIDPGYARMVEEGATGEQIRRALEEDRGEKETSKTLSDLGIAGIRYRDQLSRPEAQSAELHTLKNMLAQETDEFTRAATQKQIDRLENPTHNYVVFNDKDLEVISRNGEALRSLRESAGLEPMQPQEVRKPAEGEAVSHATHAEDRKPFAGPPPGFTKEMYDLYLQKIAERRASDADWLAKRALEFQRKTQSAEWKANRAELRPKIADELKAQPSFAADSLLRAGDIKLDIDAIADKAGLPEEWMAKGGIHPDDLAGLLGVDTGPELLAELRGLVATRGDQKPDVFARDQIDNLTDQRMAEKYGDLDKNIIAEAKDQVLSGIQEEILHQETMARAAEAGLQYSIPPEQLKAAVVRGFNQLPISAVKVDKFLADAGRAGRKGEVALLKTDAAGAFREAQRREFAFIAAREAKKVEKEMKSFDRVAKRFSDREVKGVEQEYTNWVHQILLRIGAPVKRSLQDLGDSISRQPQTELGDFVQHKESFGLREVPVADFLLDAAWKKNYDDLTVEEFRALKDSVKTLEHNGRDESKMIREGDEADLAAVKEKMLEQIKSFKAKTFDAEGKIVQPFAGIRHAFRTALVSHLQAETVMNRLDHFDPKGVFSQYVFRELASGANNEALMLREYSKKLGAVADDVNLREKVQNNIFTEPFNKDEPAELRPPMAMTRKNLRAVLLNAGNENNLWKMARGYGLDPSTVRDWLHANATKEDWNWGQKIWNLFAELKDKSDTMYRSLSGIEPESLQIEPIETPHGTYKGGYYPLIRHPMFSEDVKLFKDGLEGQGYVRATTPAGYTKKRTGAIYPLSLDLDSLPNQIRQVIHDISLRPAVLQAAKIFYDKGLMAQMKRHLGPEYADMFIPWLRDVANVQNFVSSAQKDFGYWSDFARQNAITTLVGFNPGTALKHTPTALISSMAEVGPMNFLKALRSMTSINEETGDKAWRFAIDQSEELQRRSRNWSETMGGGLAALEGRTVGQSLKQRDFGASFMSLREAITELSSKPVALGDLLSAVPTWIAKYGAEMEDHGIHGDAVAAADKAVRQAHGSSAITSRSAVARSQGALAKWLTGFFTFFNDLFNRQVETVWRAGEIRGIAQEEGKAAAMKESANVAGRVFAYVIAPAMIEELVTPLSNKDHDSWAGIAAKSLLFTLSSSWAGVRDVVNAALNKRDPSVGLLTTYAKSVTDFIRDFEAKKGTRVENVIKHGTQLSGMLTGLTPAPIGRAAEFSYKVRTGQERPRGPWGWLVGLRYGTTKGHSATFDQYMRGK